MSDRYQCKVLADSVADSVRLTTLEVAFPRIVLAEFNTHRMLSRNSASSRAIPVDKRIAAVRESPFVPTAFAANKRGMQAGDVLDRLEQEYARSAWLSARDEACRLAEHLAEIGVHKQWANRLLEPFAWHTVIVTATEWENFFALRCSPEAQPEIRTIAVMMQETMRLSTPTPRSPGEWHLPLVSYEDYCDEDGDVPSMCAPNDETRVKLSVARCARVSYLTHDGRRDVDADLALYDRLLKSGHMSPFEHAARVAHEGEFTSVRIEDGRRCEHEHQFIGNFRRPWVQHRKELAGEDVFKGGER